MPIDKNLILQALEEVRKKSEKRKFSQNVDLIVNLKDIDLKTPGNRINELIELPHAPKPTVKITVFASGNMALIAEKAGADNILGREDIERLAKSKKDAKKLAKNTDFFLADTSLMATVGKLLGAILGPRGKMPTPVPPNASIDIIINKHRKSSRVRIREQLNLQIGIGKEEMDNEVLADNIQATISLLERRLIKGSQNIRSIYIKTTMGPLTKINAL